MLSGLHSRPSERLRPTPGQPRLTGLTLHSSNFFPETIGGIFWACFHTVASNWRPFTVSRKEGRGGTEYTRLLQCEDLKFIPAAIYRLEEPTAKSTAVSLC